MKKLTAFVIPLLCFFTFQSQSAANDLLDGLVAWYPLDGNAMEYTANARHGTIYNDVVPMSDRYGNPEGAMYFSGPQQRSFIDVPGVDLSGQAMSLSVFANADGASYLRTTGDLIRQDGRLPDFLIQFDGGQIHFGLFTDAENYIELRVTYDPEFFTPDVWRLITATYDGRMMRLYFDAELVGELPKTGNVRFAPIKSNIGRMTGNSYFRGGLDDVRYYNRTLTPADMRDIMSSTTIGRETQGALVSGAVYSDNNGNCVFDAFDAGFQQQLVHIMPSDLYLLTDNQGGWQTTLAPGDYSASIAPVDLFNNSCPDASGRIDFTVNSGDVTVSGIDLGREAQVHKTDLEISLGGAPVRPGFEVIYKLHYRNSGTTVFNGRLHFELNEWFEFVSSERPPDEINGNSYSWNIENLGIGGVEAIRIRLRHLAEAPLGEVVCNSAWAEADRGRELLSAMYDEFCHEVRGSYDPNDISVKPGREIAEVDTDLSYLIRFQNTGTAPAANIVVKQQLPEELNINRFRQGAVSHNYEFFIDSERMATWVFKGIELPDNKADETASHGFIKYRMQLQDNTPYNLPVGATAEIYFDFNEAVITNTAEVELVNSVTDVDEDKNLENDLQIVFKPDADVVSIYNDGRRKLTVSLLDLFGRSVRTLSGAEMQMQLSTAELSSGAYFLRVESDGAAFVKQIVLQR